ncbi:TPA: hypothetical protein ACKP0Q_000741 [Stenotrophomonas maltophilia]
MTTDNKTLADVQPGGRVRLGDALPPLPKMQRFTNLYGETYAYSAEQMRDYARAALSAQPSQGGQGDALELLERYDWAVSALDAELNEGWDEGGRRARLQSDRDEVRAELIAALAARQPVGEPVADAGRSAAYDAIDRFLRNNMDDEAYAAYVEHLEALWAAVPAQAVDLGQFREAVAYAARSADFATHVEIGSKLRELLALIDSQAVGK